MRADNNTVLMRLIANRPHLFHAHLRTAGLADFLCIGYAAGRGDFDGVDASLEILRDCGTRLFRGAAGQCDKRGAMPSGIAISGPDAKIRGPRIWPASI